MSFTKYARIADPAKQPIVYVLFAIAWCALFLPAYTYFGQGAWRSEENGHMPFILAICVGTAWSRLNESEFNTASKKEYIFGSAFLLAGLSAYFVGTIAEIDVALSSSQTVVALAVVIALFGVDGAKKLWFPLLLSAYMIVFPGWLVDGVTAPLKRAISAGAADLLFAFGLPVAQSGAIISAGSYQLLVANACAGLNSIFSLTSIGFVYLYIVKRKSISVNLIVIASLLPLAILANFVRVVILILITYFYGYDAGQSFVHELAGLVTFMLALGGMFAIDALAATAAKRP